jgi:hypothetical protein
VRALARRIGHRLQTAGELMAYVARRRPWLLPVILGLLLMVGVVSLAQATYIAPFIYTLF